MRDFVADAGHQLRTPLTIVMGHVGGLARRANDNRDAEIYESVLAQCRRMRDLIDDLILLTRLDADGDRKDIAIDVNSALMRLAVSHAPPDAQRIVVTCRDTMTVLGRESEFFGAIDAIIDNALKYSRDMVEITAEIVAATVVITVADRGPGLDEQDAARAFDRFYRGGKDREIAGSGLGLSIARGVIERMNGSITLRNRDGGGLVCRIELPAIALEH
jgi:signal transduction histidine kinase